MQGKSYRNSSIELLRIIIMYMIVLCHFTTFGDFSFDTNIISIPRLWCGFIEMGGNVGVDVFVLVSGYFLINRKGKICNNLIMLWLQVFFYQSLGFVFFIIYNGYSLDSLNLLSALKLFCPILFQAYWFVSTYFVLFLLYPFLNIFFA